MEAFSLLKYWRPEPSTASSAAHSSPSPYSSDGEDGPFFDLQFSLPETETDEEDDEKTQLPLQSPENLQNATEDYEDVKISLSSNESTNSPSDELFFNGDLVSIDENTKFSLVKAKFRVLMLKLKKSKCTNGVHLEKSEKTEIPGNGHGFSLPSIEEDDGQGKVRGKLMAVKLEVPILSLFTRDNSSKEKGQKRNCNDTEPEPVPAPAPESEPEPEPNGSSDDRKLTKEVVQKYLKMVKPLYVRVSKRYTDRRSKGGGAPPATSAAEEGVSEVRSGVKQGNNLQTGLKEMRKRLGKSRSSPAVVTAPAAGKSTSDRRDDSLLQVQDGIQGAILHCKRSFNASRDEEPLSPSSTLYRSTSDPSYEKST